MKSIVTILAIFFILLADVRITQSIPAFARQYRLSCQTCHTPAPRLKAYGDEFAGNGFVLADKENSRYFVETGDENLSLIRDFPIAVRMDFATTYNTSINEKSDLGTPFVVKLLSGGSLTTDIGYYFNFLFSNRGIIFGVEDAFIMFNNLFALDLDLYIGQFQISDPLMKRELRLTVDDYEIYRTKVGLNNANLTYDRGAMLTLGLETGTDIIAQVVNGNGIGSTDLARLFDDDKNKSFFGRVSQDIGEWIRIGAFGYIGKQDLTGNNIKTSCDYLFYGPDATLSFGDVIEINMQYVCRSDNKTLITVDDNEPSGKIDTRGAVAELIVTPNGDQSKQYGVLLLNYIESDMKALNMKSATVHLGHVFKRNIRFFVEYTYNSDNQIGDYSRFMIGIGSAF